MGTLLNNSKPYLLCGQCHNNVAENTPTHTYERKVTTCWPILDIYRAETETSFLMFLSFHLITVQNGKKRCHFRFVCVCLVIQIYYSLILHILSFFIIHLKFMNLICFAYVACTKYLLPASHYTF